MPLQLRRGTEAERQALTAPLANGEPLWIPVTSQLYIGDGSTPANLLTPVSSQSGGGSTTISDTAPVNPVNGNMWFDTVGGRLYVYFINTWVDTSPSSSKLTGEFDGSVFTSDGLTQVIDGSTGYVTTDTVTSVHNFSTALQLGTPTSNGSEVIYNNAGPFVSMYATTTNTDPKISFNTSNGTMAGPTAVIANDKLGSISFAGLVSSTNFDPAVTVSAFADSAITNNKVPGRFVVTTRSANGINTNTLTFDSSGNLTVPTVIGSLSGNASTATIAKGINVYADAADRDASISPGERSIGMLAMLQDDGTGNSATSQYTASGWVNINGRYFTNSAQLAGFLSDETGTGSVVFSNSPSLITPSLGTATASSINKVNITTPASSATLTLATGSSLVTAGAHSITLTSTADSVLTLPTTGTLVNSAVTTLSSLSSVGTVTTGTWSGLFGAVTGANLTNLTAANLTGTIPGTVLGNSSVYIGTTAIALNRASSALTVAGLNTDGYSGALKTATGSVVVSASTAPTVGQVLTASSNTVAAWATPDISTYTGVLNPANGGTGIANTLPTTRPSLLLDFANSRTLDPRVMFTRATTATYYGFDGLIKTAVANEPRFDFDPVTLQSLGLLTEEQRSNLLNLSETLAASGGTQNSWTVTNLTRTSTTNIAPDGNATALQLTASAANGTIISTAAIGTSAARTLSVFLKRVTGTGNIQYTTDNGTTWTTQAITSKWVRYIFPSTTADQRVGFRIATSGDAIQIWGVQLEVGTFATSYIPTTTTTVVRNADVATISGTNFSSWYNQAEGTIVAKYVPKGDVNNESILTLSDTTTNNRIAYRYTSGNALQELIVAGSATQADINSTGNNTIGQSYTAAFKYSTTDNQVYINGVLYGTPDTVATIPTVNTCNIGSSYASGENFNGNIAKLAFYPVGLGATALGAISLG